MTILFTCHQWEIVFLSTQITFFLCSSCLWSPRPRSQFFVCEYIPIQKGILNITVVTEIQKQVKQRFSFFFRNDLVTSLVLTLFHQFIGIVLSEYKYTILTEPHKAWKHEIVDVQNY